ncbi:MAG: hypothetical protein H7329_05870, partial [Opitutaceae bacterium]|nr:hypothetical protein [Cytophagales bacterium]
YRLLPLTPNEILIGTSILFKNSVGLGTVFRSNAGLSVYTELALDSEKDQLKLLFNYNTSFFKSHSSYQNSIELGIKYMVY